MKGWMSIILTVFVSVAISVGVTFLVLERTKVAPSTQEKQAELAQVLDSGVLCEAFKNSLKKSGAHQSLLAYKLCGGDVDKDVLPYVRVLYVGVVGKVSVNQCMATSGPRGFLSPGDLVNAQSGEAIVPCLLMERVQSASLWGSYVITSERSFMEIDQMFAKLQVTQEMAKGFSLVIKLLPDTQREDTWKEEVIFNDTIPAFVTAAVNKSFLFLEGDGLLGIAMFKRPEPQKQALPLPRGIPYTIGTLNGASLHAALFTVRSVQTHLRVLPAVYANENEESDLALYEILGQFGPSDIGSPVFLIDGGSVKLVGILVDSVDRFGYSGTGLVMGMDTLATKVRESGSSFADLFPAN